MSLQELKEGALQLRELRSKKEQLDAELKQVNEDIKTLECDKLDVLMSNMGVTDVTVDNVKIKRGVVFRGSVTSHTDKDAFKYLFDTNNEGALKQSIIIDLATQPDALEQLSHTNLLYEIKYTVHHMTLSAILKHLVSEGKLSTDDFEKYSIYAQPQIKVEMK